MYKSSPRAGFEPATAWLTARRSATKLPGLWAHQQFLILRLSLYPFPLLCRVEDKLKAIERRIEQLERKLDTVLNLLLQDLYEEEQGEVSFTEMEHIEHELGRLT